MTMRQFRLFLILLLPSVFSVSITMVLAGVWMALNGWSKITDSSFVKGYLGNASLTDQAPASFTGFFHTLFSGQAAYFLLVIAAAAGVSVLVYLFLGGIESTLSGILSSVFNLQSLSGQPKHELVVELLVRTVFRTTTLIAWIVYSALFIKVVLPFSVLIMRNAFSDIGNFSLAYIIPAYLLVCACLHAHVIFLRLFLLRPRVFGSSDIIAAGLE